MINISNPLNPIVEGVHAIPDAINFEYWVKAVDDQLYAATLLVDNSYAQHILDVSNPASPAKIGEFDHFNTSPMSLIEGVEVNGYNYYPSRGEGLLIYQCHDCIILDKRVYLPLSIKK